MITTIPDDSQPGTSVNEGLHLGDTRSFEELASSMPETAQGFLADALPPSNDSQTGEGSLLATTGTGDEPTPAKRVNVSKKMQKAMKKFKSKVADVPIMWFHQQAKQNPEWELDDDERELLTDAIETVFEVLDIEVEIQPLSWKLTSIYWVISYPILAFVFLFLTKKSVTMQKEQEAMNDNAQ